MAEPRPEDIPALDDAAYESVLSTDWHPFYDARGVPWRDLRDLPWFSMIYGDFPWLCWGLRDGIYGDFPWFSMAVEWVSDGRQWILDWGFFEVFSNGFRIWDSNGWFVDFHFDGLLWWLAILDWRFFLLVSCWLVFVCWDVWFFSWCCWKDIPTPSDNLWLCENENSYRKLPIYSWFAY